MKTEKRKNSALKKLIPAVAMLATSAVMLSTATYAWFTMNKEVQMTGLKMTATTGEGIEIALAQINANDMTFYNNLNSHPDDSNTDSWKSSVVVGNYYEKLGKLRPSSSADGTTFFDETNASNGGKVASEYEPIALNAEGAKVGVTARGKFEAAGDLGVDENNTGYYLDIPVHIRTSKVASTGSGNIKCKIIIKNTTTGVGSPELYKAVRVQFIKSDGAAASANIYGVNNLYYKTGAVTSYNSETKSADYGDTSSVITTCVSDGDTFVADDAAYDTGLDIEYATSSGTYGHLDFIVRVWLEGESQSCYDLQAGQSWNIDFAFSLEEPTTP